MRRSPAPAPRAAPPWLVPALLVGAVSLFLAPYLFQGRSMVPLDLLGVMQPWAAHARELWPEGVRVHNPLLDSLQQYYPRRVYFQEALRGGWLPFWNPCVSGGTPFLATQQAAVFYPPAWLLALWPPALQFGWSALLHQGAAALGGYWFLRQQALGRPAAAAGALAFALNGFVVVWLAYPNVTQWTLCWLPVALALFEWDYRRPQGARAALAALVLALGVLGGHGQSSCYLLLGWGAWALVRCAGGPRPLAALARHALLPGLLALALCAAHLAPALEYLPRTDRGDRVTWEAVVRAGMPAAQLWTMLLPRLFGDGTLAFGQLSWLPHGEKSGLAFVERSFYPGIAVLALAGAAGYGARGGGDQRRLALFCALAAPLAVLLAMATPLYWPLWRVLPGFGNFTAVARVVCLAAWPLACLAALGVEGAARGLGRPAAVAALLLALAAGAGHFIYGGAAPAEVSALLQRLGQPGPEALAVRDLVLALLFLATVAGISLARAAGRLAPGSAGALLAATVALDLAAFGYSFNPATDPALARAETPELAALRPLAGGAAGRFLSVGPPGAEEEPGMRMNPNLPGTYGLADLHGTDSFFPRRYVEWRVAAARAGGGHWARAGSVALRAAGVRYYLLGRNVPVPGLNPVSPTAPTVREDAAALPYARLHTHVQPLPPAALAEALAQPDRAAAVALTGEPGGARFAGAPRVRPWNATRLSGNRLRLTGEAPAPGLLVVCEGFDPGWGAVVDGRAARVEPADLFLVGVPVPAGATTVELRYVPPGFRPALYVTLLALAALAALAVGVRAGPPAEENGAARDNEGTRRAPPARR